MFWNFYCGSIFAHLCTARDYVVIGILGVQLQISRKFHHRYKICLDYFIENLTSIFDTVDLIFQFRQNVRETKKPSNASKVDNQGDRRKYRAKTNILRTGKLYVYMFIMQYFLKTSLGL